MGRSPRMVALLSLAAIIAAPMPAHARIPGDIRVTLAGRAIPAAAAASLHCHDLDHPVIRCYRTVDRLDRALARSIASRPHRPRGASIASVAYVRVYEHSQFEGASITLSVPYDDLSVIGWNDRISSWRAINGGSGTFWHHIRRHGTASAFCCATSVANVGSTHNDRFSSVAGSA